VREKQLVSPRYYYGFQGLGDGKVRGEVGANANFFFVLILQWRGWNFQYLCAVILQDTDDLGSVLEILMRGVVLDLLEISLLMTLIKNILPKCLFVLTIFMANTFVVYSQGRHASLQLLGNVRVDYGKDPVLFAYDNSQFEKWYVDDSGVLRLRYSELDRTLRNSEGVSIYGVDHFEIDFFVPKPGSTNLVYCFGRGACVVVDTDKGKFVEKIVIGGPTSDVYLMVHHSDGEDVWILYFDNYTIHKYLFSRFGVEYCGAIKMEHPITSIRLSKDCRFYSAVNHQYDGLNYVYYGTFDRMTGNCVELANHCYSSPRGYRYEIDNSIISIDNSRIYYNVPCSMAIDEMRSYVIEVPIIDGVPNFLNYDVVYSFIQYGFVPLASFFYGCDCIYTLRQKSNYMERFYVGDNGNTIYDSCFFYIPTYDNWGLPDYLVSTWHLQNVCDASLCPNPPSAQFDNASLCYGEQLNVILDGEAPFSIDYTLDGKDFSATDISTGIYSMPDTPGRYSITKVSDRNCSSVPETNNNAVIGKEMEAPRIKIR